MSPEVDRIALQTLPLLPVKNTVLFPSAVMPFSVGRAMSMAAVEAALATEDKEIVIVAQRDASVELPGQSDLYAIGTRAVIKKSARRDEYIDIIVHGVERVVIVRVKERADSYIEARVRPAPLAPDRSTEIEALRREVVDLAGRAHELSRPRTQIDFSDFISGPGEDPVRLVYTLGSVLSLELEKEQAILDANSVQDALRLVFSHLRHEVQVLEIRNKIASDAQSELNKQQREYVLRQQLRAIQNELGESDPEKAASDDLRQRFEKADLPEDVGREAEKELNRLERVPAASPEHGIIRTYLELVLELPWNKADDIAIDIAKTREVLDADHYDLKEVKERILEHLGVLKLNPSAKAPILCFVGPPGVGKTSLGQSIARSMGRKFERMSLGGLSDEAELRGHRRTYIGAMPGRVLQALRRAGVNNPVVMLDEVDKLGRDFRGDPAAALLEILDPEQNRTFRDNYLDMPFDISKVLFVTTANTLGTIPQPLLDRMEVLRLAGYAEEEKLEIAKRYLVPRQIKETGLQPEDLTLPDATLRHVIERYTRESGVRRLERAIGRLARKIALRFAEGNREPVTLQPDDVADLLGPETFFPEKARQDPPAGVAAGLAVTETGGDVLYIESTLLPDSRGMTLTGQLGEVMQESARAAQSWLLSHANELGIEPKRITKSGVHIHVPAGAIPKDGPSAGVTMASALASLYTGRPLRYDTAMTGEITLTGLVLPVGGIKEKVLAARRAGLKRVVLPGANKNDLRDLPDHVRSEMEFIFADRIDEVFDAVMSPLSTTRVRGPKRQTPNRDVSEDVGSAAAAQAPRRGGAQPPAAAH